MAQSDHDHSVFTSSLGYEHLELLTFHSCPVDLDSNKVPIKPIPSLAVTASFLTLFAVMSPGQILLPGPMLIAHIEGQAYLNEQLVEPSSTPIHIYNESVVRTEDGRAEIRLAGGVSLFLGENAAVKRVRSSTSRISGFEMLRGSGVVATGEMGIVATCSNEVILSDSGLYRFDLIPLPELSTSEKVFGFSVYEGAAAVKLATVVSVMTPGKYMSLNLCCGDLTPLQKFHPKRTDTLDD